MAACGASVAPARTGAHSSAPRDTAHRDLESVRNGTEDGSRAEGYQRAGRHASAVSGVSARRNGGAGGRPPQHYTSSWLPSALLIRSATSVPTAPDSKYRLTAASPNSDDRPSATSGAKAAPNSQPKSVVSAAPV